VNVLKGLTRTVRCLSFEFTPEFINAALECISYLTTLGFQYFNFSEGESMQLAYLDWLDADRIIEQLLGYERDATFFGDVYARRDGG
jgi:hypothetical protein